MSKLSNLQSALNSTRDAPPSGNDAQRQAVREASAPSRQANRHGKVNVAAWMSPGFKASLRMIQARRPGSIQELLEEALNDLFAKYDVPQIALDR